MRKLLLPFSWIYYVFVRLKNFLYDKNLVKSYISPIPAIVIGNLTVGGTGKTPFTIYLARLFAKHQIAILSRGYKRKTKACLEVNSQISYRLVGDEPKLIHFKTKAKTFVCADRLKGINFIKQTYPQTELIILDDALQHRRLKPDLSITLIDWNRPVDKDLMLPAGNLRDNTYRIRQTDIVIFSKCPTDLDKTTAKSAIKRFNLDEKNVFFTYFRPLAPYNPFTNHTIDLKDIKKYHVVAFSGLGNNKYFRQTLKDLGVTFEFTGFSDHKNYTISDLKKIFYRFAQIYTSNKVIITTEKDLIKILELDLTQNQTKNIYALPIEIGFLFDQQEEFNKKIYSHGRKLINKNSENSKLSEKSH